MPRNPVTGDVLQASGVMAVGQRNTESTRRCLRRSDARYHLDSNPGSATRRDLLAGAGKHAGIATLESDHLAPSLGKRDHECIDLFLFAGRLVTGFTDHQLLGLASGKIKKLWGNEVIDQNDVSRLQGAHRPQCQQFWIPGAGADQNDAPGRLVAAVRMGEKRVELR